MKKNSYAVGIVVLIGTLCRTSIVYSATTDATSKIAEVTVFPDQATVVRRASVELTKGEHTIRLTGLPGVVQPNSITAKGKSTQTVKIFGAELVTTQLEQPQDPRVREIQEKLTEVQRKEKGLNHTSEILSHERDFLKSIQPASANQIGKDLITRQFNVEEVNALYGFLDKEFLSNFTRVQEVEKELEELQREKDRLNRELGQLNNTRWKQETAILVEVEAEETARLDLEVSYRIPGASWYPSYEARVDSNSQKVQLVTYGLLRQQTGEEWESVQVTLSTARPSLAGQMPELPSWFLRKWEVGILSGRRREVGILSAKMDDKSTLKQSIVNSLEEQKLAEIVYAQLQAQGPAVTYILPKAATIRSDGQAHKLPIVGDDFTADFAYETTPKLIEQAFLRAKVKNTTESLYLAGFVQVFLDEAFVGTSSIKQVAPQETFDLFLGVDERIKVKRKILKDKIDVSLLPGLQGKTKTVDRKYLTVIENYTPKKAKIILNDQLPISQHDDIKVEAIEMNPKQSQEDKEKPGVYCWVFELEPGKKQEQTVSFRLRHPADWVIEGL